MDHLDFGNLDKIVYSNIQKANIKDITKLLKDPNSKRSTFFTKYSFDISELELNSSQVSLLIEKDLVDYVSEVDMKLTVTLKGYLVVIYGLKELEEGFNKLLDDINQKFYKDTIKETRKPLDFYEKTIIVTMLGLMTFTSEYSLKISKLREKNQNFFEECINKSSTLISEILDEESGKEQVWRSEAEGNKVISLLRRTDSIQTRTENIYKKTGGDHYLDIIKDGSLDKNKISFLMKKIFPKKKLTYDERKKIENLLQQIEMERLILIGNEPNFDTDSIMSDLLYKIKSY
ncbi:MAG: hypothetical protein ACYCUZ_02060 [Cuniculiplasma sp.]